MIPLTVPNLLGNEKEYLDNCIDTSFVSSVGEYVNRFEEMTAKAVGSRYAVATSAGTTGLHAALTAIGVEGGDLVIVPSFTFIASANAIRHCGAYPWLMDIDEKSWCLNPVQVRDEIGKNCKRQDDALIHIPTGRRVSAIMPVYTLGNIPDMTEFRHIADEYGVPLVVDAACAIGSEYDGDRFGGLADLSVLSFNGNKTITCGGGGAVVGNDERLCDLVRHLTTTARVWPDYDFDMVGFNYRMTNIQAAVGCAQMERLNDFIERKRYVRGFYRDMIVRSGKKGIEGFPETEGSGCWLSGLVLSDTYDKKSIIDGLNENEVEAKTFWKPVHLQKPYEDCPKSSLEVTENIWDRIITLPCSTGITDAELETVAEAVIRVLR